MRAAPGQVVGGRYRVTDRPDVDAVRAVDLYDRGTVLLRALQLPELLVPGELFSTQDPEYGERIARRVEAVLPLMPRHHRLLTGVGVAAEDDLLWVAEERLPGARLSELAEAGPVPPYRVAELAADLAGALRAVHEAGLTHGNVTAESVLVCEDGAAMLGGLLQAAAEETLCAELGGPLPRRVYEARAVLIGPRTERWPADAGAPADCWALGVLLFRLLTGYGSYPEDDLPSLLAAVRDGQPYPADGCGPLRPLVEELLQADPAKRPSASEVQRRLRELLAAAPEPYGASAASPALLPVLRPAGPLVPRRRPGGRRTADRPAEHHGAHAARRPLIPAALLGPVLVAGVLAVLLVALAAVVLLSG